MIYLFSSWIEGGSYLFTVMLMLLSACGQAASPAYEPSVRKPYAERVELAMTGYNYTNRYIDDFSVNGNGGGNVFISSPTSGGGKTACCISYRPGTKANTVTVSWQSGACYYHEKSRTSEDIYDTLHPFYRDQKVTVSDAIPPKAQYMEVHFYPDGSVQAAVTSSESPPRLLLSKKREDVSKFPRCPNDQKPD